MTRHEATRNGVSEPQRPAVPPGVAALGAPAGELRYAFGILGLSLFGQLAVGSVLVALLALVAPGDGPRPEPLPGWALSFAVASVHGGLLALVVHHGRRRVHRGARWMGWTRPRPSDVGLGLVVAAAGYAFNVAFTQRYAPDLDQTEIFRSMRTTIDLVGLGLVAVLVAPVFEEVLFRGLFYPPLAARHGAVAAVVLSGALFALPHLATYWRARAAVVPVAVLGLGLGWLRARTGSLVPGVVAHAAFNAAGFAAWCREIARVTTV